MSLDITNVPPVVGNMSLFVVYKKELRLKRSVNFEGYFLDSMFV